MTNKVSLGLKISELKDYHIGEWVEYCGKPGERERGRIKSWNDTNIFVVYNCGGNWRDFKDYTGASTRPEDLVISGCRCYNPGEDDGENTCWVHHDCNLGDCTHGE